MGSGLIRRQAFIDGASYYFTGEPCIRGHVAKRSTVSGQCVECARVLRQTDKGRAAANRAQRNYYARRHPRPAVIGSMDAREIADTVTVQGVCAVIGSMDAREIADAFCAVARKRPQPVMAVIGSMDAREAADAIKAEGKCSVIGSMKVREQADAFMAWRERCNRASR